MDELIDVFSPEGQPTGETILRSEAHRLGVYHATVHVWFYSKEGEILFQKRAATKDTFPEYWDVSVAGHISAGENPLDSAIREVQEEIGSFVTYLDLYLIGTHTASKTFGADIIDNELHYIYCCKLKEAPLSLNSEEVEEVQWIPIEKFLTKVRTKKSSFRVVPHSEEYFNLVYDQLTTIIRNNP